MLLKVDETEKPSGVVASEENEVWVSQGHRRTHEKRSEENKEKSSFSTSRPHYLEGQAFPCQKVHAVRAEIAEMTRTGQFSNFDKSCPNSIESDPGPFESIIMHFRLKVATQEASDYSMNDPIQIQKNGQKFFLTKKWSRWLW